MLLKLERARSSVRASVRVLGDPRRRIEQASQHADNLNRRLFAEMNHRLRRERSRVQAAVSGLEHLNPLGVLSRGYSITRRLATGEVLKDSSELRAGELLRTTLLRGAAVSRVEETEEQGQQ
jgi:exodeoxyribonuclease VII large subunit